MPDCTQYHVSTRPAPPKGQGQRYGQLHDVIRAIHPDPKKSGWMKSYCVEGKHFYRHKTRQAYCRRCKQYALGIQAVCKEAQDA